MAGKKGYTWDTPMTNQHRTKIGNSKILKRLIGHAEGTVDMSQTQVTAGLGLMKKVLPDLSASTLDGELTHGATDTLAQLLTAVANNAKRIDSR